MLCFPKFFQPGDPDKPAVELPLSYIMARLYKLLSQPPPPPTPKFSLKPSVLAAKGLSTRGGSMEAVAAAKKQSGQHSRDFCSKCLEHSFSPTLGITTGA